MVSYAALYSDSRRKATRGLSDKISKKELIMPKGLGPRRAIDEFIKAYPEIEGLLFKGLGMELQFLDSKIMNCIIKRLLAKGIFPLPIHDSAIVQERHVEILEQAMDEEYEKVMYEETEKRFRPGIK